MIIAVTLVLSAGCTLFLEDVDEYRFVGSWVDGADAIWYFEDNNKIDISEAPLTMTWSLDSSVQAIHIWSIFRVFNMKANYSFVTDDEIELRIFKASGVAESNGLYEGSRVTLTRSF